MQISIVKDWEQTISNVKANEDYFFLKLSKVKLFKKKSGE